MRAGIIQSAYLPWRGYFDFIASVDVFVLFDDVQFPKGRSWRTRNAVKTPEGRRWISVPVEKAAWRRKIDEVRISPHEPMWVEAHRRVLTRSLEPCPHFSDALALFDAATADPPSLLSELNERLLRGVCDYLGISTPLVRARTLGAEGTKTARLLSVLHALGADDYLSGPVAQDYLDEAAFREAGVGLAYKRYAYADYPQPHGPFDGQVTVLDLIANAGEGARSLLRSLEPDVVVLAPGERGAAS